MIYRFDTHERPTAPAANRATAPAFAPRASLPPHDLAAERAIVGAVLTDAELLPTLAASGLRASDFFSSAHQTIYSAAESIVAAGNAPDEVTICAELHRRGELANIGGPAYINELTRRIEVTGNAPAWAQIVRDASTRRKTIAAAERAKETARDHSLPANAAAEAIARDLAELSAEPCAESKRQGLMPFPVETIPQPARALVEQSAIAIQVPHTMPAIAALGVVSAALGKLGATNPLSDHVARANLFIVGVAEQGTGKGETFKYFLPPLYEIEKRAAEQWEANASGWRSELASLEDRKKGRARKDDAKKEQSATAYRFGVNHRGGDDDRIQELNAMLKGGAPVFIGEDMTAERMETILEVNKGELFVASSEAKRIFENIGGRNNRDVVADDTDVWCKVWAGDQLRTQRMSRSVMVDDPRVSMLAFVQGDVAREFVSKKSFFSRGLLARILFADTFARPSYIDPSKGRARVSQAAKDAWAKLVNDCHAATHDGLGRKLRFSSEAARRFIAMHNEEVALSLNGHMESNGVRIRRVMQAERISLVLHAMKHGARMFAHEISPETAEDACRVELFFRQFQTRILEAHVSTANADKRERIIKALREASEPLPLRQLRLAAKLSDNKKTLAVMVELLDAGLVAEEKHGEEALYRLT